MANYASVTLVGVVFCQNGSAGVFFCQKVVIKAILFTLVKECLLGN